MNTYTLTAYETQVSDKQSFTVEAENAREATLVWSNTKEGKGCFYEDGGCTEVVVTDKDGTESRFLVRCNIVYNFKLYSEIDMSNNEQV